MLLQKESELSAARGEIAKVFNRSWIALALLLASMLLNLPPYFLSVSYYYLIQACAFLALLCIVLAVSISFQSLRSLFQHRSMRKGAKYYWALTINLLIIALFSINMLLWAKRLIAGA